MAEQYPIGSSIRRTGSVAASAPTVARATFALLVALTLLLSSVVPADAAARNGSRLPGGHRSASSPVLIDGDILRFRGHATSRSMEQGPTAVRLARTRPGQLLFGDWNGDGVATPGWFDDGRWHLHDEIDASDRATSFWFGRAGDEPFVGDWDGDGRTTVAIRRGSRFHLSDARWRTAYDFPFGRASDDAFVGDWNGDGRTTVGIRRDATFHLTNHPRGGAAEITARFGRASDEPVVGDWNGTGRDTIGVRRGARYFLSNNNSTAGYEFTFGGTGSEVVMWPGAWARTGCPTAVYSRNSDDGSVHTQVQAPALGRIRAGDPNLDRSLQTANRYLLNANWQNTWQDRPRTRGYYDVLGQPSRRTEHDVRPPAMTATSLAISLRTGYDAAATGQSRAFATSYTREIVRSLACQHKATTMGGWGDAWQSAYWAQFVGLAGWLIWDELTADERFYVARMVQHEADRLVERPSQFWRDADGNGPRNTYAEVLAWDASLVSLASAMMPQHPHRDAWMHTSVRLGVAAGSMPDDLDNHDVLNGKPVDQWIDGYNVMDGGLIYNHSRISPDYSTAMHAAWSGGLFHTLAGQPTPEALFHNAESIYGALSTHDFDSGTVYTPWSFAIRYPEGSSWSTNQQAQFVNFDAMAGTFGLDGSSSASGADWQRLHTVGQLHLQARHADGRTYRDATEHRYPGREELTGQLLAYARLTEQVGANGGFGIDDTAYGTPAPLPDPPPADPDDPDPTDPPPTDPEDPDPTDPDPDDPDPDPDHPEPEPEPFPEVPASFDWLEVAVPLAGDVHRDGRADVGWWHDGEWTFTTADRRTYRFHYGRGDDEPLLGDWNGDGRMTPGIRRGATFHLTNRVGGGAAAYTFTYGRPGDVILVGDWNGDGRHTVGVRRGATFYLSNAPRGGPADVTFTYGRRADEPLVGDWNGDGTTTVGIKRGRDYHLTNAHRGGPADYAFTYGWVDDVPVIGDFNGNGRHTVSIVRATTFHINDHPRGGPATRSIDPPRPK